MEVPQNGWFTQENPMNIIKMDDLGVPPNTDMKDLLFPGNDLNPLLKVEKDLRDIFNLCQARINWINVTRSTSISSRYLWRWRNMGVSIVMGVPQNGWFILENLINVGDLRVPPWLRNPPYGRLTSRICWNMLLHISGLFTANPEKEHVRNNMFRILWTTLPIGSMYGRLMLTFGVYWLMVSMLPYMAYIRILWVVFSIFNHHAFFDAWI